MIPRPLLFALLLVVPRLASGQNDDQQQDSTATPPYSHPIGFHDRANPDAIDSHPPATVSRDEIGQGPKASIYILGGAAIGALAAGTWLAIELSHSQECICPLPIIAGVAVGAGGLTGGLLGLVVYGVRKEIWEDDQFQILTK